MNTLEGKSVAEIKSLLVRPKLEQKNLNSLVHDVFQEVELDGDRAVLKYAKQFDGFTADTMLVSEAEIVKACSQVPEDLKNAIQQAAKNIEKFHAAQQAPVEVIETMPGISCWRKSVGIDRVGLYIPGGTAPLFSTVLMLAIPAKLAGCKEIVLTTPANKSGVINAVILYTAQLVGVTKIYKLGGIQAIAALALGTESIPNVYKIFGPGNQYVTAAKQYAQNLGVAIDMPAGPSEVMVVADASANPSFLAADLLSQAEHGADSQVVLLSTSTKILVETKEALAQQLANLPRKDLINQSLAYAKFVEVAKENLLEVINDYGPEHLILATSFNETLLVGITNAGSVFIGEYTPESLGDYASGTNHTLPTNGFAKAYSGVSLDSFVKKITYQEATKEGLKLIGPIVEKMAEAEELMAHKDAVSIRLKTIDNEV